MTTEIPKPRRPEPLPGAWLGVRNSKEGAWENYNRATEERLRDIQAWAEEMLTGIFLAQSIGEGESDPTMIARINDLYDTIRNALTRQDLVLGFLLNVQERAHNRANEQLKEFSRQLKQLTDPDVF